MLFLAVHVKYFRQTNTWFGAQKICQDEGGRLSTEKDNTLSCDELEGSFDSVNDLTFWSGEYTTMSDWISREGIYRSFIAVDKILSMAIL